MLSQEKSNHGRMSEPIELAWTQDGMLDLAEKIPEPSLLEATDVILSLIQELYEKGQWISTSFAAQATTGAYATLCGHPSFPPGLNRKSLESLLRAAQLTERIKAESYKAPGRHVGERWKVR